MEKKRVGFAVTGSEFAAKMGKLGTDIVTARGIRHRFTPEESLRGARKGGDTVSSVPGRMAELGRKGGLSRGAR